MMDIQQIDLLREKVRGPVLQEGEAGYDEARVIWNGMIDRKPRVIVRCKGVADVIDAVNFGRDNQLDIAIRGGGHNVSGNAVCDGGVMIDLSLMKAAKVDPVARTAWVQGGAQLGDLDRETQLFALVAPAGVVSDTGVAGLTLGGGTGWVSGKFGLTVDNLISVDLVTAEGKYIKASDSENSDLFWGLKGGGGNFGVATSFEFHLQDLGPVVMRCMVMYPEDDAENILANWREVLPSLPDEVTTLATLWRIPAIPAFPDELHNKSVVTIFAVCACSVEEGEKLVQPLRELGEPLLDLSGPVPFVDVQQQFDPFFTPQGEKLYYWKSLELYNLDDEVIQSILDGAKNRADRTLIVIQAMRGQYSRVAADATAFGDRSAPFWLELNSTWLDPKESDDQIAWTRNFWSDMQRFSSGKIYLNHPGFDEEDDLVKKAYGDNYERLVALKDKYDPDNLFHMNQNIKPSV
ncbi:MAG: FAD-binding oxidoreductase [Gammaproteobacteria bacterium]|jgi:FAD/FMN-containing dehydrogenase|nr:FAD-binding oxidoreductase [Gammaproteobacteria bacterium]